LLKPKDYSPALNEIRSSRMINFVQRVIQWHYGRE
jgi:hypothetical protein